MLVLVLLLSTLLLGLLAEAEAEVEAEAEEGDGMCGPFADPFGDVNAAEFELLFLVWSDTNCGSFIGLSYSYNA